MKFCVIKRSADGSSIEYVYSSNRATVHWTRNIDNAAMFAREENAKKVVRSCYADGVDLNEGCSITVGAVELTIVTETQVPAPAVKSGFVVQRTNGDYWTGYDSDIREYAAMYRWSSSPRKAKLFKSMADAQVVIDTITDLVVDLASRGRGHGMLPEANSMTVTKI